MPDGAISPTATHGDCSTFNHESIVINASEDHFVMCSLNDIEDNSTLYGETALTGVSSGSPPRWCESCLKLGHKAKLKLVQINLEDALYMCTNNNCQFPFFEANFQPYLVKRSIGQIVSSRKRKKTHLESGISTKHSKQTFGFSDLKVLEWNDKRLPSVESSTSLSSNSFDFSTFETDASSSSESREEKHCCSAGTQNICRCTDSNKEADLKNQVFVSDLDNTKPETISAFVFIDDTVSLADTYNCSSKKVPNVSAMTKENENFSENCILPDKSFNKNLKSKHAVNIKTSMTSSLMQLQSDTECPLNFGSRKKCMSSSDSSGKSNALLLTIPRKQKMVQWSNESNLCWLDVLMLTFLNTSSVRAVFSKQIKSEEQDRNIIFRLLKTYDECQEQFNYILSNKLTSRKAIASFKSDIFSKLRTIRLEVFKHLQTRMTLEQGKHESVLEVLPHFLGLYPTLDNIFSVQFRWEFNCEECRCRRVFRSTSSVVSFICATPDFHPLNASYSRKCFSCSAAGQRMNMIMEIIPPCLVMHFREGLPQNHLKVLDFGVQEHLYCVTAVIQYVTKPFNHFIVWIRDCKKNKWMCCDDLKNPMCNWKSHAPKIPPKEIHMILWEKQVETLLLPIKHADDLVVHYLSPVHNEDAILPGDDDFPSEVGNVVDTITLDDNCSGSAQTIRSGTVSMPKSAACKNITTKIQLPKKKSPLTTKSITGFSKLPPGITARSKLKKVFSEFDSTKTKRNFKLAGYQKARITGKNLQILKAYDRNSPEATQLRAPSPAFIPLDSAEKMSDISDLSDYFPADFDQLCTFSDGSVTTASQSSDARSWSEDFLHNFAQSSASSPCSNNSNSVLPSQSSLSSKDKVHKVSDVMSSFTSTPTSTDLDEILDGIDLDYAVSEAFLSSATSEDSSMSSCSKKTSGSTEMLIANKPGDAFDLMSYLS